MKKASTIIIASLLAAGPLFAQKLFITGDVGYGFTSKSQSIKNDTYGDEATLKASGGIIGGLGIGANYGKYDIIGGWQYNQVKYKTTSYTEGNRYLDDAHTILNQNYKQLVEVVLKDSGVTRHDITIGGRVRPMEGALQPYLSGKLGMGFWSAKMDNETQTIRNETISANEWRASASGIKFVYGLGLGLDYQATEKVAFGAFYNYSGVAGDYSAKFDDGSKAKINAGGTHYVGAGVKIKF